MRRRLCAFIIIYLSATGVVDAQMNYHFPFLENRYEENRFCTVPLRELKNSHVREMLTVLREQYPNDFHFEIAGESVEKRPIYLVRMGSGGKNILLWSQMHGDEPTSTAAIFDMFNFMLRHESTTFVRKILENATILVIPMLNPDGAEKYLRRNAQGIDINRDARDLQTPEGRILFDLKETFKPDFGFNLHDQSGRITVGNTNRLAAFALMAPPFNHQNDDNPVRIRAKKVVSVIYQALGPSLYGHISKYKADYMPRAFGDSMQSWGVSTILIESSGWYHNRDNYLQKMNFVALLSSIHAIASGSYESANPAIYDILPLNDKSIYDLLIRDVNVIDGTGIPPYRMDIGVNYNPGKKGYIIDNGDLDFFAAKDTIDAPSHYLTPGFICAVKWDSTDIKDAEATLGSLVEQGFTTVLISCRPELTATLARNIESAAVPVNVGYLIDGDAASDTLSTIEYLNSGAVGIAGRDSSILGSGYGKYTHLPVGILPAVKKTVLLNINSASVVKELSTEQCRAWKIRGRGKIRRGQIADMLLFAPNENGDLNLETIFVQGHIVWQQGEWTGYAESGERWIPGLERSN
ncbi:MAG: M14 family zinc carboxypeptidase [candidate division KSB1 bacterium]|jgi:hypothetical protein|nr:M14 family zinc carboxypeptidase [candidate division KSB1 bacterium]